VGERVPDLGGEPAAQVSAPRGGASAVRRKRVPAADGRAYVAGQDPLPDGRHGGQPRPAAAVPIALADEPVARSSGASEARPSASWQAARQQGPPSTGAPPDRPSGALGASGA
jgi:hypothetical protein